MKGRYGAITAPAAASTYNEGSDQKSRARDEWTQPPFAYSQGRALLFVSVSNDKVSGL